MNDTQLTQLCLAITLGGMLALALTYEPQFEESSISELGKKEGAKGILHGRIETVIKNYPITLFILDDKELALVYYPRATTLEQNDFVKVYAENRQEQQNTQNTGQAASGGAKQSKKQISLYAQKVEKQ